MKKFFVFLILIISIGVVFSVKKKESSSGIVPSSQPSQTKSADAISTRKSPSEYIFVPYWSLSKQSENIYDTVVYFGITAHENGVDTDEQGYKNISQFLKLSSPEQKKLLTVRILNQDIALKVLNETSLQDRIIQDTVDIVKTYSFDGVVLDYETSALFFQNTVDKINAFYKKFSSATHGANLQFLVTVYGDVYFRARPYDVKAIADVSDRVLIMAYDFHKARGNPGPNFPLAGKETYGYDFETMIDDFSRDVDKEKLAVIFGMFGYDWIVDGKGVSSKTGTPLSLNEIKSNILKDCESIKCSITKDVQSAETIIQYQDFLQNNHIVWFENMESMESKKRFAQEKGITSFGYWAYSYF